MPTGLLARLFAGCAIVCSLSPALGAGRNPPLTTPKLLIDLARDHGLNQRGTQDTADVAHVRALLKAAIRLDPNQSEAHRLLYELAVIEGDRAAAARLLPGLLEADPLHEGAFALWLETGMSSGQTIEQQDQWLKAVAATRRPAAQQSQVHVQLARLALRRMDTAEAQRQLESAIQLEPANVEAAHLALETLGPGASAADQLSALLRVVAASPFSIEVAWQVATLLDDHGLVKQADLFYEYASAVHAHIDPNATPMGGYLLDLARHRLAQERIEDAISLTRRAIASSPTAAAEAGMYLHYLLASSDRASEAENILAQLRDRFAPLRDPEEWPVNEVAQAAWLHCTLDPQPQRALMLAQAAAKRAPRNPFVLRVLGWAQAANLQFEDARKTLEPIAFHDAFAAGKLAQLLLDSGDQAGASQVIAALDPQPTSGPRRDYLATLNLPNATSRPVGEQRAALVSIVAAFDARVLDFYQRPEKYLQATITVNDRSPAPGEPWWATFTLTNRGPFPITLGPDAMVNPVFVLSFDIEGDRRSSFPALTTVSVGNVRVLTPGETIRTRDTLDIGPLRWAARRTPQQLQRVTIHAVLDAQADAKGEWRPALGGQALRPVYFNRVPTATGGEAVAALLSALAGDSDIRRFQALEVLTELIGETEQADLKRLSYKPAAIPADRIRSTIRSLLTADSWELRARTLDSIQLIGLDRRMMTAVENCLAHDHWLVRFMALRVMARQGDSAATSFANLAKSDPDEQVRELAQSYLARRGRPSN